MSSDQKKASDQKQISDQKRDRKKNNPGFQQAGSLFSKYQVKKDKGYITQEFQDYAYRLALELDDLKHKSLYFRMAKREDRGILERARSFVSDSNAKSRARLFMWKVKQLKDEVKAKTKVSTKTKSPEQKPAQPSLLTMETEES